MNEHASDRGKVRIAIVEVEGGPQALAEALRCFAVRMQADPAAPAIQPALPAPAPARKKQVRRSSLPAAPVAAPAPVASPGPRGTFADALRAAVREAPRTSTEILDCVKRHGFTDADSNKVSVAMWALRKSGEVYKDEDLKWQFAAGRS